MNEVWNLDPIYKGFDDPAFEEDLAALKEKVANAGEIRKAFPGYDVIYGVFSKSGFTQRMLDAAKENPELFLINEDSI